MESGCVSIREVKARITPQELVERVAYWALEAEDEKAAYDKARRKR